MSAIRSCIVVLCILAAANTTAGEAKVLAVLFYADWCGSCKVLDPQITRARGSADLDSKDVLFVRLDLTNPATRHQASLLADSIGLGEYFVQNAGKTGFLLLTDAEARPLRVLTKDSNAAQIVAAIDETLAAQSI